MSLSLGADRIGLMQILDWERFKNLKKVKESLLKCLCFSGSTLAYDVQTMEPLLNDDMYYSLTTLRGLLDLTMRLGCFLDFFSFSHVTHIKVCSALKGNQENIFVSIAALQISSSALRQQWSHLFRFLEVGSFAFPTIPPRCNRAVMAFICNMMDKRLMSHISNFIMLTVW